MKKMHVIHMLIRFIDSKTFESGTLVSGMSTVWEDTGIYANKYRCALAIYSMNLLSSSFGVIMYCEINAPVHENDVVNVLKTTDKLYLK